MSEPNQPHSGMPRNQKSLAELPLTQLPRRDRSALVALDAEWPDSRGLMARVAMAMRDRPRDPEEVIERVIMDMLFEAAKAYREAHQSGEDVYERLGSAVDAMTEALPRHYRHLVARNLSPQQKTFLAKRLPPSQLLE